MPSFDVVSKIDYSEVKNAVANATKAMAQRYDFKGSISKIELDSASLIILAEDDMKVKQVTEILVANLVKRRVDPRVIKEVKREPASGNNIRVHFNLLEGIQANDAKILNLEIKKTKLKVKSQIQGDELRVSGTKKDDLQQIIQVIKNLNLSFPIQFINLRD